MLETHRIAHTIPRDTPDVVDDVVGRNDDSGDGVEYLCSSWGRRG